jgi:hypothetical protein
VQIGEQGNDCCHCHVGVLGLNIGSGGPSGDGIFDDNSAEYQLYTRVALSPGDQVYLQYGCYTNLELLGGFLLLVSSGCSMSRGAHLYAFSAPQSTWWHSHVFGNVNAEHYGFQLDDNPHDMALLPRHVLARALGLEAAAALPAAQAALHACGAPSWALLQVALFNLVASR